MTHGVSDRLGGWISTGEGASTLVARRHDAIVVPSDFLLSSIDGDARLVRGERQLWFGFVLPLLAAFEVPLVEGEQHAARGDRRDGGAAPGAQRPQTHAVRRVHRQACYCHLPHAGRNN